MKATTRTYAGDYAFGKAGEEQTLPTLNKFFKAEMVGQGRYAPFDFIDTNNTIFVELKTRNCSHNQYPTLWINYDKVATAKSALRTNPERKYYFAFNLKDGIWYAPYDEELFSTFTDGWFQRRDRDTNDPPQHILNIPVEHLRPINNIEP